MDLGRLGDRGYDELWAFADLRGNEYPGARLTDDGLEDVWVSGLVIAHQRHKDGGRGSFLLVELDDEANIIGDWLWSKLDEAKEHGATRAQTALGWEPVPDTQDVAAYIRRRLREPRST